MNESVVYNCRKLKGSGLIHGCFSRDGIVRIKRREKDRPMKIFHMDKLHGLFPDLDFGDADFLMSHKYWMTQCNQAISLLFVLKVDFSHKSDRMHIMFVKS